MLSILKRAGVVEPKMWCGGADHMEPSFADAAEQKLEVLIVLGGDGTIRTAAEACAEKGPYLIPLPGGTMNILPRALYGDVSWEDALKNALTAPSVKVLFRRSNRRQTFFHCRYCGGACALGRTARSYARRRYS